MIEYVNVRLKEALFNFGTKVVECSRKVVSSRALALTAVPLVSVVSYRLADAQGRGGPPQGGSWTIEHTLDGIGSSNGTPVYWGPVGAPAGFWYPGASGGGGAGVGSSNSMSLFAQSSGSVGIRFTWSGSNQPAVSWLAVGSASTWHGDHGSGTAADGLGDTPYSNPAVTDGGSSGIRVYRVSAPTSSFVVTVGGLNAYTTVSSSTGMLMSASANVAVTGFVASKSAGLARSDGGALTVADLPGTATALPQNRYVANTLLSWDDSDGIDPGPTSQTLSGTYGGTWTKLPDGTTDNVNVNWSGASGGPLGFAPSPGVDHHTTSYPAAGHSGTMPLADQSGSPKTQDWKYSVTDLADGTELDLTCHWICHYAYENYNEASAGERNGNASDDFTVYLTSAKPSGDAQIIHGSLSLDTAFSASSPTYSTSIPGFTPSVKHAGIPTLLARNGQSSGYTWDDGLSHQTRDEIFGDGLYGIRKRLKYKAHVGTATAWNSKGASETQTVVFTLDTEGRIAEEANFPLGLL